MRKLLLAILIFSLSGTSFAGEYEEAGVENQHQQLNQHQQSKKQEKNRKEVVLKVVPLTPPKPIVDKDEEEFEKTISALKRQLKLLELKLKIKKTETEIEKLQNQSLSLLSPKSLPSKRPVEIEEPRPVNRENPEFKLKERMLQIKLQREQERLLSAKLSYLQNLFTGVVEVNGKRVAFDSVGRKYTKGSFVEGFRIVDIFTDGIVVTGNVGGTNVTYKVPIGSGLSSPKRKTTTTRETLDVGEF